MFERYTESARRTLFFARYEASHLGSISIETEHLLLGLMREGKGLMVPILAPLPLGNIRRDIESRSVFREKIATSVEIPFSAETKRVLNFTAEEADRLLHSYIGTEHLLLGLLREENSVAGSILAEYGLRLEDVRVQIVKGPGETATSSVSEQIDQLRALVEELGRTPPDSSEFRALVDRIGGAVDGLRLGL
jgi:ATP-dependent Clp protease ATP-binding subunit ClpC